jgi:hypothetical protein
MQRARLPYLLIPVAAFLAIIPLLINGSSCGHDFDFHLLSWMEAARQFTHGNPHPHWAYTAAYNAGEPRFVFYPPVSWTIGAILGLLLPWTGTPIVYTWLALTAAGLAAHYLVRDFTTPSAATLAAVLYTVNPYMLFTAYERTAYAEFLAAAWIPLLLHAILRDQNKGGVTIPRIAIPIALLWLTNAPAAVMSCYALALLTAIRLATNSSNRLPPGSPKDLSATNTGAPYPDPGGPSFAVLSQTGAPASSAGGVERVGYSRHARTASAHSTPATVGSQTPRQLALNTIAGTTLGLGLAAFYILPAAYQRRYVQIAMAIIPNMRIQDNFLFHRTGDAPHDQVLHTASLIAVILIILTTAVLLFLRATKPGAQYLDSEMWASREAQPSSSFTAEISSDTRSSQREYTKLIPTYFLTSLTTLTIAITLLLTPLTTIIWTHAPELAFLQFPWRLTAILAAILTLAIALVLSPLNLKPISTAALALTIAAALTYPAYTAFHQTCDEEDTVRARLALFQSNRGTEPTDEYTPINADNDSLAQTNPPNWLAPDPNAKAPANTSPGPTPTHLSVNAPTPEDLILNLRDYPAWRITLNGTPITDHIQRDDGLIALPIPVGPSTIDIHYAQTLDQILGDIISITSLALLVLTLRRRSLFKPS